MAQKIVIPEGCCEGSNESDALGVIEFVEEIVIDDSKRVDVSAPVTPSPILVLVCFSSDCVLSGSLCSKEVSQETISLGSGTIVKSARTCSG